MSSSRSSTGRNAPSAAFLLWQGQAVSRLGDQAFLIAEMMLVGRVTGSSLAVGAILLASFIPSLVLLPIAGALADRWPRQRIVIGCDLISAAVLIIAAVLIAGSRSPLAITLVVATAAVVKSAVSTLFQPAFDALVADVASADRLARTRALLATSGSIAGLVGQALAGVAFDRIGGAWLLAIDAASFLISGLACAYLRTPPDARRSASSTSPALWRSGMAGLALVWRHPVLRRLQWTNAVLGLVGIPCFVAMPALLRGLGADGVWLGWTYAAGGLGGLLGGVLMQTLPAARPVQARIACLVLVACNMPYLLLGMVSTPRQVVLASGLTGFLCTCSPAEALIQRRIPRAWMGRYQAGAAVTGRLLMPIGMLGGGALADALGPHAIYGLGGIFSITVALGLALDPRYRRFLRG
jgi:MFS family permease